ncbi:MAG: S9 family peptidase [Panacagrimonas sp.]
MSAAARQTGDFMYRFGLAAILTGLSVTALATDATPARVERGNLVLDGIPEIPTALAERLNQFQQTRGASLEGWLPGGGILITTRFGETAQVHRVDMPGGARHQLSFYPEPIAQALPMRDGKGFVFGKDSGGNEFYQLYAFDFSRGAATLLTDGKSRNTSALASNIGDVLAFSTTRRNGRDTDIHVLRRGEAASRPVLESEGSWEALDFAPDDRRLLAQKYVSITDTQLWLVPLQGGAPTRFHPSIEKIAFGAARFSRDGRGLYYVSDEGADVQQLRYENFDGSGARVLSADLSWNVEEVELSGDGAYLAYTINVDGFSELRVLNLKSGSPMPLPKLPRGVIGGLDFDPGAKRLGFVVNSARNSSDVYSIEIATRELLRWTFSETGGLDVAGFTEPELIRYRSFDGREIPAYYYRAPASGPRPVLIQIHGGPEAQALPTFSPITEFFAREMGVSVLVPNVRGSDGYGKTYLQLDNGLLREDSVKDIGSLLDWIGTRPELDKTRIAVAGGSYGGYMTLASLTHYNDRLRCGVDTVGISNFVTFLNNTQDYRRDLRRVEYGDERDPTMREFLERISPTTHAARITKPLFVIQGANDPRVPASEAEQIVATVRANGGEVWYLLAKDEGHGFRKKSNRDLGTNATALFLQRCLGADE